MESKNNNGNLKIILLVAFIVVALVISGFIVYDKFIKEDEVVQNDNGNNGNNNPVVEEKEENVKVLDAVKYDYESNGVLFSVRLPKIEGYTKTIKSLNDEITSTLISKSLSYVAHYASSDCYNCMNKGFTIDYDYIIKNDVIALYVYSSVPEGGMGLPATGSGLFKNNYFYDIKNDKLLKLSEAAEKLGVTDLGELADSYDDLVGSYDYKIGSVDDNVLNKYGSSVMIIDNGKISIVNGLI